MPVYPPEHDAVHRVEHSKHEGKLPPTGTKPQQDGFSLDTIDRHGPACIQAIACHIADNELQTRAKITLIS